jgi:hypothetical protein
VYFLLYYFQIAIDKCHFNLPLNLKQKLFWRGFCENALPNEDTQLTLMDWLGRSWDCNMRIETHPQKNCYIYGQWTALCKTHGLIEGVTITLGVTNPSNNKLIHFKISPSIGVRTTWVEHRFML